MGAAITLHDVAHEAGVSVATASRALSGRGDLSRETRQRVADAARRIGYARPSDSRGRPTTFDSRLIELVLGSFDDAWTAAITNGAREGAFRLGYDLVLTLERDDPDDDWPARVATRRPHGVVLGIIRPTNRQLDELRGLRIPVVLLEPRSDPDGTLDSVGTTDRQGGYDAGAHLVSGGYERFAVLNGQPKYRFGRAREDGFRAAIADLLPASPITPVASQWSLAPVTESLLRALSESDSPVGVFACNDEMALSVYRAAAQLGRRIPEDVGIVGFNDEPRAALVRPALTSVRQPLREIAARAVEVVADLRVRNETSHHRIELPSELVVRASTATPICAITPPDDRGRSRTG